MQFEIEFNVYKVQKEKMFNIYDLSVAFNSKLIIKEH